MTSPRAESDLLMFWASLSRSPCTSVFASLSLPAKSTSQSLLFVQSPFIKFFAFTIIQSMLNKIGEILFTTYQNMMNKETEKRKLLGSWIPVWSAAVLIHVIGSNCPSIASSLQDFPDFFNVLHFGLHNPRDMMKTFRRLLYLQPSIIQDKKLIGYLHSSIFFSPAHFPSNLLSSKVCWLGWDS